MRKWIAGAALCAASVPAVTRAQPQRTVMVVARPATIGLDQGTADAFADLLRGEVAKRPDYAVVATSATPPEPCGEAACGANTAQATQASVAVALSMSKLGDKVVIRVTVVDQTGRVLLADRVSAATAEDLDPLSIRVATSVAEGRAIGDTVTVSTVTEEEAKEPRRRKALFTSGMRIGGGLPLNNSYGDAKTYAHLGVFSLYELGAFAPIVEAAFDWTPGRNEVDFARFDIGLGARVFVNPEAPTGFFLGGGVGYRFVGIVKPTEDDYESGYGGYLCTGAVFLRTADLHIVGDLRYDLNFFEQEDLSNKRRGQSMMFTLGFSYTKGMRGMFR